MTLRLGKILHSPVTLVAALVGGAATGFIAPEQAEAFAPFGRMYIDLLKMVALPFIVASIIFSVRSLIHDPRAKEYLAKVVLAIATVSFLSVAVAGILSLAFEPGTITDPQARVALGHIVSREGSIGTDLQMNLFDKTSGVEKRLIDHLVDLVPSNIFQALAAGDTVKALIFALLFGLAVGRVPGNVSDSFAHSLDTVYRACIVLTRWFSLLLPFVTFAMMAEQAASVGLHTLRLMFGFLAVFGAGTLIFAIANILVLAARSRRSPWAVLRAHQDVIFMAITTRSSVACIPIMIDTLTQKLGFRAAVVELLVPLQTALVRAGPIFLLTVGPIFIAQLYGKTLSTGDLVLVGFMATLLGPTSVGTTGLMTLSQVGIVCGYLGLPFEAAFALFIAVDAIADPLRSLMLVLTINGATGAITPREAAVAEAVTLPEVAGPLPVPAE